MTAATRLPTASCVRMKALLTQAQTYLAYRTCWRLRHLAHCQVERALITARIARVKRLKDSAAFLVQHLSDSTVKHARPAGG